MWTQRESINTPQQRHIPLGAIPIVHAELGTTIAMVMPQPHSGETQVVADIIQRAPDIIRAVRELDALTHKYRAYDTHDTPDISLTNAWRRVRTAMSGLDIHPPTKWEDA